LGKRDEGAIVRPSPEEEDHLDGLARGVADGTISRGRAIKLAGAALVGSTLALFSAQGDADALTLAQRRRRCQRKYGGNGVLCTGGGRTKCCDDRTTGARRCQRGRCSPSCAADPDNPNCP
jgi:hypothetical protein